MSAFDNAWLLSKISKKSNHKIFKPVYRLGWNAAMTSVEADKNSHNNVSTPCGDCAYNNPDLRDICDKCNHAYHSQFARRK